MKSINPGFELRAPTAGRDQGASWKKERDLTRGSRYNHTYPRRPVDAHPDFYAFGADRNPKQLSESRLYFANRAGEVRQLPAMMREETARPEIVKGG